MPKAYTFNSRARAHTISRAHTVTIPDQVYADQKGYDGKSFPVLRADGSRARAQLAGDEYGLWTPGTGDPVVRMI